ncbi:TDP-N-acetylfucosamine:lipid II N-acetylfucosaminyltransferase [Marinobacterium aestuarii]|uniref:TDP-N-acetylfucosamine:lipid II N-acetylfucosaminyltransferase n=1 Tax=Marinobacterium aestuarii TaxID=1821621 RepID=UPI0009FDBAD1|nr:TDP-N-acetylfucosamine:lipid II N-acetylfucosaminyltransferase [Marinobacterium aestuarii]
MRFIHLVQDEKFIDFFADTMKYSGIEHNHRYIVYGVYSVDSLVHVFKVNPFRKVDYSYFNSKIMLDDLSNCDVLVVHFLTFESTKMIKAAPDNIKIVWSGWGADYYHLLPGGESSLLGPETKKAVRIMKIKETRGNPWSIIKMILRPLRRIYLQRFNLMPAIRRVDFFSSPIPNDFYILKSCLGDDFSASYVQLNYGGVNETFTLNSSSKERLNILVGNSATPTNNHMEVFRTLAKCDLADRKIIVPLCYGDTAYRNAVLNKGRELLGSNFYPIVKFMSLFEYNKLIGTCSVAIMNHYRQQALGNIGFVLYNGGKLYLSNNSNVGFFLRDRGAYVFDVNDIGKVDEDIDCKLDEGQKNKNRQVIEQFWGADIIEENVVKFIKTVNE